jgi:hypothetical protein
MSPFSAHWDEGLLDISLPRMRNHLEQDMWSDALLAPP